MTGGYSTSITSIRWAKSSCLSGAEERFDGLQSFGSILEVCRLAQTIRLVFMGTERRLTVVVHVFYTEVLWREFVNCRLLSQHI